MPYYIWTSSDGRINLREFTKTLQSGPLIRRVPDVIGKTLAPEKPSILYLCVAPVIGVLSNPLCPKITAPLRMFEVEPLGEVLGGTILHHTEGPVKVLREVPCPELTAIQRAEIAIRVVAELTARKKEVWWEWAEGWLSNEDRSVQAGVKASNVARAALAATAAATAAATCPSDEKWAASAVIAATVANLGIPHDQLLGKITRICHEVVAAGKG